jgi:hypothetical protein
VKRVLAVSGALTKLFVYGRLGLHAYWAEVYWAVCIIVSSWALNTIVGNVSIDNFREIFKSKIKHQIRTTKTVQIVLWLYTICRLSDFYVILSSF